MRRDRAGLDEVDDRQIAVEPADPPAEHERPPRAVRRRGEVLARPRQATDPSPRGVGQGDDLAATPPGPTPPA